MQVESIEKVKFCGIASRCMQCWGQVNEGHKMCLSILLIGL